MSIINCVSKSHRVSLNVALQFVNESLVNGDKQCLSDSWAVFIEIVYTAFRHCSWPSEQIVSTYGFGTSPHNPALVYPLLLINQTLMYTNRYWNVHIFVILWQVKADARWRRNYVSLCLITTYFWVVWFDHRDDSLTSWHLQYRTM